MSDLIRRSDAIEAIYEARRAMPLKGVFTDTMSWAIARANAIPTIEPKRGEWIVDENGNYRCSVCGVREEQFVYGLGEYWYGRGESNYCPNCGARMKGADNES